MVIAARRFSFPKGKDFSRKFPGMFAVLKDCLPLGIAVDGEVVAFDETGS